MGEHDTWYTLLPFWPGFEATFEAGLRRDWQLLMFQATHFTMTHVIGALIAVALILAASFAYRQSIQDEHQGIVPQRRLTLAAMIDGIVGAVYQLSIDTMGEENAKRYLPFTGSFALFIFCCNIQGLVPGFLPPTDTLKTNLALSLIVFITYVGVGIIRNPKHFLGEFLGPSIGGFPWLFPLFLPLELVSHFNRPVSLSLRLLGNIVADHKVLLAVGSLIAILAPVPFLLLGVLVAIVQTLIFTLLTIVYLALALAHADGH